LLEFELNAQNNLKKNKNNKNPRDGGQTILISYHNSSIYNYSLSIDLTEIKIEGLEITCKRIIKKERKKKMWNPVVHIII